MYLKNIVQVVKLSIQLRRQWEASTAKLCDSRPEPGINNLFLSNFEENWWRKQPC